MRRGRTDRLGKGALAATLLVFAAVVGVGPLRGAEAADWPGCDAFRTQPDAQTYWEQHGRPPVADRDGDGRVCESLPTGGADRPRCTRTRSTVTVELSRARYPESTLHFEVAWRQGSPRRYTIARGRADANRDAWDQFVPEGVDADRDGEVDDRDEVPMAFTREGGRKAPNGRSASNIAYVDARDNRGAGSSIGGKLRRYCNGTRFKVRITGKRTRTAVIVIAFRNGKRVRQEVRRR